MRHCLLGLAVTLVCACSGGGFDIANQDGGAPDAGADSGSDVGADSAVDTAPADAGSTDSREVGPVGISVVQSTDTVIVGFAMKVDPTVSFATHPAAGNAVILGVSCFSEVDNCTIPTSGVTDSKGNTWLRVIEGVSIESSVTHGARGYIFIAPNIAPTTGTFTIKVNPNGDPVTNLQSVVVGAIEVAGLATISPLDRTGLTTATGSGTSTTVATTFPTTLANELAVAVHTQRSNDADVAYVHETGWTQHHVNSNGVTSASPHSMVSKVLSATGVVSHTWMHDVPTRGASAIIATFKGR